MSAISVSWLDVSWGAVFFETNYGLMQHSCNEIRDRLLNALDSEYNVRDMATVFDVVAVLERTPITTEILESTRLGKLVNECRRRTKNETLARRAKLLVRRWREVMNAETAAAPNPAAPPPNLPPPAAPQQNGMNARSPNMGPLARAAAVSPSLGVPSSRAERLPRAASISPALQAGRHYGSNVNYNNNNHSCSSSKSSSSAGAYAGACANLVSPSSSSAASSSATAACARSPLRDSKVDSVPRTHASNKRLRKNASAAGASNRSSLSPEPPTKKAKMNGALFAGHHQQSQQHYHEYAAQRDAERLLSPPSAFGSAAYAVAERLADNAGASAADDDDDDSLGVAPLAHVDEVDSRYRESATIPEPEPDPPPAPVSSKKRRSKKANKKKQSEEDVVREKLQALSKTGRVKTTEELVAELKSLNDERLVAPAAETDNRAVGSTAGTTLKPSLSNSSCYGNEGAAPARRHLRHAGDGDSAAGASCADETTTASAAGGAKVPLERLDAEARVEREIADILARLPPLDPALVRWDEEEAQSPPTSPPPPPTDEQVERYLRRRWDGVNGCVTHGARRPPSDGEAGADDDGFREWHEMVARHTANDDLIHILPYSIVD